MQTDEGSDMAEVEFSRRLPLPRDLEPRPTPDDFRPRAAHRVRGIETEVPDETETEVPDSPAMDEVDFDIHRGAQMNMDVTTNLPKLQQQLDRKPLDEIAMHVRALTYGEMIEFAEAMWKVQPDGSDVTQENLPALLHRWSISRLPTADHAIEEIPFE